MAGIAGFLPQLYKYTGHKMDGKHIFLTLFASLALGATAFGQTARSVLDKTAAKLQGSGGIEASFEGTRFKGTQPDGTATGKIQVQGKKYKVTAGSLTTWYDGATQWTMLAGSGEVNVSTPSDAEAQQTNPYAFVNLYKKGYDLTLSAATFRGKACHEVRMTAQRKDAPVRLMILTIDKQTSLPLSVRIKDAKGQWTRIRVSDVKTRQKWADSVFRYDEKQHPGVEVVDLR